VARAIGAQLGRTVQLAVSAVAVAMVLCVTFFRHSEAAG
jgi:hypothetical protein